MAATLYTVTGSHPAESVRLMLDYKGVDHEVVHLFPGLQPLTLRARRFPGTTVPALRLEGRRLQGSLEISRVLEQARPEPSIFPGPDERRAAIEEAERWGESELQPVPRRLFRWCMARDSAARRWYGEWAGIPMPALSARATGPWAQLFARMSGATDEQVDADIESVPGLLDRVDELIGAGTIGGEEPNAADFQIATTIRFFGAFPQFAADVNARPCGQWAARLAPDFHTQPLPADLPA
jgi:glutathione S-transferase